MNSRAQLIDRAPKTQLTMEEYFCRNFVLTTSGVEDHLALEYSIRKVGIDNVMWAIDYPYQPTKPAVDFMDSAPVSEVQRAKLYPLNAERIFHIRPLAGTAVERVHDEPYGDRRIWSCSAPSRHRTCSAVQAHRH